MSTSKTPINIESPPETPEHENEIITMEITEIIEVPVPDFSHIVTEDDTPVDNLISEKQQR